MMNEKPRNRQLGRGLSALLGKDTVKIPNSKAETEERFGGKGMMKVPVEFLSPNPYQPRQVFDQEEIKSLANSIGKNGMLQPILVRVHKWDANRYEIIAGERRWRAAQKAQLHEVPIVVHDLSDEEALEAALIENIQREDLNPLEEAEGYNRLLKDFGHTQEKLSEIIGKSRSHIANTLRLLGLPREIKSLLSKGELTAGHARALIGAENINELARTIIRKNLNVRQVETLVKGVTYKSNLQNRSENAKDPNTRELERRLTENLGLKVELQSKGEGGKLAVHYKTLEQLDEIIRRLSD